MGKEIFSFLSKSLSKFDLKRRIFFKSILKLCEFEFFCNKNISIVPGYKFSQRISFNLPTQDYRIHFIGPKRIGGSGTPRSKVSIKRFHMFFFWSVDGYLWCFFQAYFWVESLKIWALENIKLQTFSIARKLHFSDPQFYEHLSSFSAGITFKAKIFKNLSGFLKGFQPF